MKAVIIEDEKKVVLGEVDAPVRKKGEALIRVKACGICGSDVSSYRIKNPQYPYPLIIGHETAGEIMEIDENDRNLKVGDRIILDPYIYCGKCYPCSKGQTNCCEQMQVLGCQTNGSMCEYFTFPVEKLIKVPDVLKWEEIPIAEPLTIALHAIHRVKVQPGEFFTVIGAGAIGLMAAVVSKVCYGATPIIVDVVDGRLKMAKDMGIEYTINSMMEDAVERISVITNGRMSECVMEASGAFPAIADSLKYAAYTGRIARTGWPKGDTTTTSALITRKELVVLGSRNSAGEFEEALDILASGKLDLSKIISKVVPFDQLPEALQQIAEHPNDFLKIVGVL